MRKRLAAFGDRIVINTVVIVLSVVVTVMNGVRRVGNMDDVARAAGVSVTTVSHVVNNTRTVRPSTRQRVEDAIAATGFRRNALASALVRSRSNTIGMSISALTNPYFGSLLQAVESQLAAHGYHVVVRDSHDDAEVETDVIDSMLDWRVDGLLVAPSPGAERISLPQVARSKTPLVILDRRTDFAADQVCCENLESVRQATEHLLEIGHRRIAVVAGLEGLPTSDERVAGVQQAVAEAGLDPDVLHIVHGKSRSADAAVKVAGLLSRPRNERPSALIVLNNAMTIGAMQAIRSAGLQVPEDIALICFDDFEWADLFEPRLTAIAQDIPRLGRTAVDMLLERLAGYDGPPRRITVPTSYRHRASCGCLPESM